MNNRSELKPGGPLHFALLLVALAVVLGAFSLPGASAQEQFAVRAPTRVLTKNHRPTPTKTRRPIRTATRTPTRTRKASLSPTLTATLTLTPTIELTFSPTITLTQTNTLTRAASATPTLTSVPGADFVGLPLSGPAPLAVQFTQLNFSMVQSCTWDFGDGTSESFNIFTATPSSGSPYYSGCPAVTHVYAAAGTYDVQLSVAKYGTGTRNSLLRRAYITVSEPGMTPSPTPTLTPTPKMTPTQSKTPTPRCFDCP